MKIHDLKIDPEYFDDVITGEKRFERFFRNKLLYERLDD